MNQVIEFFQKLGDYSDWPPRWHCGKWTEFHGWLYIISDLLVWSAYFAIPLIIMKYIRRRKDIRFTRLYFLFACFITACGATHFLDAITFWIPVYRLNALVRAFTGVISWITVFYLIRVLPTAFTMRSAKELEQEVELRRKAEDKFRNLLETAPDCMIIVNETGHIQLVNAQTIKMFGYQREELMGKPVSMLTPDRYEMISPFRVFREFETARSTRIASEFDLFCLRKDGSEFPVEINLSPMESEDEVLITAAIRDVTEKKKMEKQIRDANKHLSLTVEQRTAELERKNKELEQFVYVASHDLQEPLRTISSFVDLLDKQYKGKLDEHADIYLNFIVQSSDRMKVLIRDLLDYSRLGRGKEARQVNCNTILEQVQADLDRIIQDSQAVIRAADLPVLDAYPTELKLLFQNLVTNAIKFRKPMEPPVIDISAREENGGWTFVFKDNGIGIDKQFYERIFSIFQRLHTRTEYEGSGIGLAHCKKIAEMHGGDIWVESEVNQGSAFYFTISAIQ